MARTPSPTRHDHPHSIQQASPPRPVHSLGGRTSHRRDGADVRRAARRGAARHNHQGEAQDLRWPDHNQATASPPFPVGDGGATMTPTCVLAGRETVAASTRSRLGLVTRALALGPVPKPPPRLGTGPPPLQAQHHKSCEQMHAFPARHAQCRGIGGGSASTGPSPDVSIPPPEPGSTGSSADRIDIQVPHALWFVW
jgi:hypothetical protein